VQVELLELREDRVRFLLKGVTPAFANAIRRASLCEVPTLAIDEISIYDNTSVLFDEQLALRLGLVPIKSEDVDNFTISDECDCEGLGCPGCQVGMMLTAEGPGTVYSRDIKFADPGVETAYKNIPIVTLGDGEKLMLEGTVTLKRGTAHARWQAGTHCGYKNLPDIQIGSDCEACGRCVEACPRDILVIEEGTLKVTDAAKCSICKLCIGECEVGAIKLVPIKDSFVMNIDSDGSIPARYLVAKAANEIEMRAKSLKEQLAEFA
jgi:DNA-directed RNA polymerase subunit D